MLFTSLILSCFTRLFKNVVLISDQEKPFLKKYLFSKPKIIYPETVQRANFSLDNEGILVDKTCFIIVGDNLEYLQKTLSSQLFEFAYKRIFSSIELGAAGFQYNKHALVRLPVKPFDNQEVTSDCDIFSIYNLSEEEINFISSSVNPNVRSKLPSNL